MDRRRFSGGTWGNPEFLAGLPFLFKLLAAGKALSIQAHPNKLQAEEGFARENKAGLPLNSPARNYKDDNHKPEILMAITPFTAMSGFCQPAEIAARFKQLCGQYVCRIILIKASWPVLIRERQRH